MKKNFDRDKVFISKEYLEELLGHSVNISGLGRSWLLLTPTELNEHDRSIAREQYDQLVSHWQDVGGIPSKIRKHVQKHNDHLSKERKYEVKCYQDLFQQQKRHAYDMVNNLQGRFVSVFGYYGGILVGLGSTKNTLRVVVKKPLLETTLGRGDLVERQALALPKQVPSGGVVKWALLTYGVVGPWKVIEVPAFDVDLPERHR